MGIISLLKRKNALLEKRLYTEKMKMKVRAKRQIRKIDIRLLRKKIKVLKPRHIIYTVLREELSLLGHWKNRRRGNPVKGWAMMKKKIEARKEAEKAEKKDELL